MIKFLFKILLALLLIPVTLVTISFYALEGVFWGLAWVWRLMMSCRKFFEEGMDCWKSPDIVEGWTSSPNIWDMWKEVVTLKYFKNKDEDTE